MNEAFEKAKTTGVLYIPELQVINRAFRKKVKAFTKNHELTGLILPNATVITYSANLKKYSTSKVSTRLYQKVSHFHQYLSDDLFTNEMRRAIKIVIEEWEEL